MEGGLAPGTDSLMLRREIARRGNELRRVNGALRHFVYRAIICMLALSLRLTAPQTGPPMRKLVSF